MMSQDWLIQAIDRSRRFGEGMVYPFVPTKFVRKPDDSDCIHFFETQPVGIRGFYLVRDYRGEWMGWAIHEGYLPSSDCISSVM